MPLSALPIHKCLLQWQLRLKQKPALNAGSFKWSKCEQCGEELSGVLINVAHLFVAQHERIQARHET
jgi:hypothetical protein